MQADRESSSILTGSSFWVVHSVRFAFMMVCSFSSVGRAIAPAVVAMYNGESAERPNSEQNSRVNDRETSLQADGLVKMDR